MTYRSYSVDTSSLISSLDRYYPITHFPKLWERVDGLIDDGRLYSSEEVALEVAAKDDVAASWVNDRRDRLIVPTDASVIRAVRSLLASHPALVKAIQGRNSADSFVIAVAQLRGATVLTEETGFGSPNRPKIPGVCRDLGIDCVSFADLIRFEGWSF